MLKKKIYGIPVFLIALALVGGLGTAALVGYLSNTVTADIEVESPMVAGISLGRVSWSTTLCKRHDTGEWVDSFPECEAEDKHDWAGSDWKDLISISGHGGETVTIYTRSKNIADAEITGFEEAIVTNPSGVTCGDFKSVKFRVDSIYGDLGYGTEHELISEGCKEITWNTIQFGSLESSLWGKGETDVTKIVVTFEEAALGTYTFTYKVIPTL